MNVETFAAQRRGVMEEAYEEIRPTVDRALNQWYARPETWQNPIVAVAANLWAITVAEEGGTWLQAAEDAFGDALSASLSETTSPASRLSDRTAQVDRITNWVVTYSINDATAYAASTTNEGDQMLEWVTMRDSAVRDIHETMNGKQVPIGETFNVAGYDLPFPGAPVGPPEVWINCRCVVRPAGADDTLAVRSPNEGEDMPPTTFAETETEEEVIVEGEDEDVYPDDRVPFHGVLAPIGKLSGDRRRFEDAEGVTWRDGPSPVALRWVKADSGAHDGAVRVANFDRIWIEDEEVRTEGFFFDKAEAQEVIDMMAHGPFGVSVDLDEMVTSLVNEDGSAFDMETYQEGDPAPILAVSKGRIAGATLVDIPAFQEAYLALGTWDDVKDEVLPEEDPDDDEFSIKDCAPCEQIAALEEEFADHADPAFLAAVETVLASAQVFAPGTKDGPGWITNPKETARIRRYWTKGKGAAKIRWGQPGDFNRCRKQLAKYVKNPQWLAGTCANMHKEALGVWPGREGGKHAAEGAIMASAFTLVDPERDSLTASAPVYPRAWFEDPALEGPTPLTITDEGRIYGHVATWDVCHIGLGLSVGDGDQCVTAPHSETGYALFRTGAVVTDGGTVPVGTITMGIGHAGMSLKAQAAAAHYDVTDAQVALVAAGEDEHGIWFSGALLPDVTEEQITRLRSAALSGDWRRHANGLEMVAALAVNVPGFPIPRVSLAASGRSDFALVAAAPVRQQEEKPEVGSLDAKTFAREVLAEMERQQRVKEFRAKGNVFVDTAKAKRLARAREVFGVK